MTKPTKWMCAQRRLRSAWASAKSVQGLRCAPNGSLRTQAFFMRTAKTLIRLDAQADLSLRWAHKSFCWFCHEAARIVLLPCQTFVLQTETDYRYTCWTLDALQLTPRFECPGWSESSLSAQPHCWFCHEAAHLLFLFVFSILFGRSLENVYLFTWQLSILVNYLSP